MLSCFNIIAYISAMMVAYYLTHPAMYWQQSVTTSKTRGSIISQVDEFVLQV